MDRSEKISAVVAKTRKQLESYVERTKSYKSIHTFTLDEVTDVVDVLQDTLKLLITHHDYFGHLELKMDDEFADLPNEIVHDVVEQASYEKNCKDPFENLTLIDGSWAEFVRKFTMYRSLRDTSFGGNFYGNEDYDEWKTKAPLLHESISLSPVLDKDCEILDLMGARFSTIDWHYSTRHSELVSFQAKNFLKRQLKSKYLKNLEITGYFETEELTSALVDFVKRPQFEALELGEKILLPFEVFEEAHKTWAAAEHFQVRHRKIEAMISEESFRKIDKAFNVEDDDWIELKTVRSHSEMSLYVFRDEIIMAIIMKLECYDYPDTDKSDKMSVSGSDCDSASNSDSVSESGSC